MTTTDAPGIWHQEPGSDIWTLIGHSTNPIDPGRLVEASLTDDELEAWPPHLAARHTASLAARLVEVLASEYEGDDALAHLERLGVDGVLQAMIDSHRPPELAKVIDLPTPGNS